MSSNSRVLFKCIRNSKFYRNLSNHVRKVDEYTVTSALPFQPVPRVNLFDRISVYSSSFKDQVALVSAETKKSYTYIQLQSLIANFGTSLIKKLQLQYNDFVAIALPNCPEYPVVALGAIRAGCVVTTVNPAYKHYELVHQFTITKPKVVITIAQVYTVIAKALHDAKIEAKIIIIDNTEHTIPGGAIRYSEIAENSEADYSLLDKVEKDQDDVAVVAFSSGTTGLPKGVQVTYKNVMAALDIMTHKDFMLTDIADGTRQDIVPCVLPFFHIYGLVITMIGHLTVGAKLITMTSFDPVTYIRVLSSEKASLLFVVPPLIDFLVKHPLITRKHFENVNYVFTGGSLTSHETAVAVLQKAAGKTKFLQGFAATETTCMGTVLYKHNAHSNYGCCGDPVLNVELRFCDPETGKPVPLGQTGEVCIRAPVITKGYYQNEQATKEMLTSDGFYKTGDLGAYKPGEGLHIVDRIKELIKVKGMQVAPAELELLLRSHPSVIDAGVTGIPHENYGEVPKAFIVTEQPTTAEEIKQFVADNVIAYKRLHEVVFVDAIPKNATGKILRKQLKNM